MWDWIVRIVFFVAVLFNFCSFVSLIKHFKRYLDRFSDDKLGRLADVITSNVMSELRSSGFFENSNLHKED